MKKLLAIVVMATALSACSALSWIKPLVGGGDSYSVDAQAGDRNATLGDKKNNSTKNDVEVSKVHGPVNVDAKTTNVDNKADYKFDSVKEVGISNAPMWLVLLMILGWCLPTPTRMMRGIKNAWKGWMERRVVGSNRGRIPPDDSGLPGARHPSVRSSGSDADIPTVNDRADGSF